MADIKNYYKLHYINLLRIILMRFERHLTNIYRSSLDSGSQRLSGERHIYFSSSSSVLYARLYAILVRLRKELRKRSLPNLTISRWQAQDGEDSDRTYLYSANHPMHWVLFIVLKRKHVCNSILPLTVASYLLVKNVSFYTKI